MQTATKPIHAQPDSFTIFLNNKNIHMAHINKAETSSVIVNQQKLKLDICFARVMQQHLSYQTKIIIFYAQQE